jgi:CRP-like cAMP-binding protein
LQTQQFLQETFHLPEGPLLQHICAISTSRHLQKGEILFREGEIPAQAAFLQKGILRGFFINKNGKEIIDCFCYRPGDPAIPSTPLDTPAQITLEALQESLVLCFPMKEILNLLETHMPLAQLHSQILQESMNRHLEIKKALYQYTAMQRYQWFLSEYAPIAKVVSGKYIASFLDMTPVTLSRLRKSLREKKDKGERPGSL